MRYLAGLLPLLLLSACAGAAGDAAGESAADLSSTKLKLDGSVVLPLNEVSGLGTRPVGGHTQIMAVGDSSTTLVTFSLGADHLPTAIEQHDLSSIFPDSNSQWEAVAGDSTGRVFLMNEGDALISVLTPDLKLEHQISLTIPSDNPEYKSWQKDTNSRGEGMLLLSNGHILVAKEKGPSALIEFAPKGDSAKGYQQSFKLHGAFKLPAAKTAEFTAVKSWELKSDALHDIGDVSELTTDADGTLVILSDQSKAIARLEKTLDVDEDKIDVKELWDLPKEIDKPEGLQIVDGKPIVSCDLPKKNDVSFFAVSAL